MPTTEVLFYQEEDGTVPLFQWFQELQVKALEKCLARLLRLEELGHELRRPEGDYLRDDIYELRASLQGYITVCVISSTGRRQQSFQWTG